MSSLSKQLVALGMLATAVLVPVGIKHQSDQHQVTSVDSAASAPAPTLAPPTTAPTAVDESPAPEAESFTEDADSSKSTPTTAKPTTTAKKTSSTKKPASTAKKPASTAKKPAATNKPSATKSAAAKSTTKTTAASRSTKPVTPTTKKAAPPATPAPAARPAAPAPAPAPVPTTMAPAVGERCIASNYDEPQMTATGEVFNPMGMTAAHKTLPLNSYVKVTNPRNGKTVKLRINDRGPYIKGRCIDLSKAAFDTISAGESGLMTVIVQPV